ncbi:hypothetical protein ABH931_003631 [Streptacidiphilus sp. MAP12-33]
MARPLVPTQEGAAAVREASADLSDMGLDLRNPYPTKLDAALVPGHDAV